MAEHGQTQHVLTGEEWRKSREEAARTALEDARLFFLGSSEDAEFVEWIEKRIENLQ